MGRRRKPSGRRFDGVLLLDKPQGITSNEALQTVKRIYNADKAGHTGSLDPLATGMLPILFGEGTKLSRLLLEADKVYTTRAKLGVTTDSGDADGKVLETKAIPEISDERLESVLAKFRGQGTQIPSMFSALKKDGKKLYELAREGIEVEREPRPINIFELTLLGRGDDWIDLRVHCSKGTYVRTLVEDIGQALDCGAHVVELRRTNVAGFQADAMVTLDALNLLRDDKAFAEMDAHCGPINSLANHLPRFELTAEEISWVVKGQALLIPGAPTEGDLALVDAEGQLVALGAMMDDGRVGPTRLLISGQ
ncbi:tRNA pseudouridine(55) synthase TruB [Litorivicinus lipolyticus]|uniref:tRNA pseudouridine synthase B n=1 Tax=Litorivicinus lipolyticus TaxID=418701 RepID=A0A5Q2QBU4_9GAMM|nr:tRNA pseudouridine(55) synthase TruB [Litorivicinus lipolyticus]QGG79486.1 tRNA pseudouridine(55) synthase TruB [Litorivicinus lipolyticus]